MSTANYKIVPVDDRSTDAKIKDLRSIANIAVHTADGDPAKVVVFQGYLDVVDELVERAKA